MSWGEAEFDGLFERLGGDDVRCPEEPLREDEAELVYRALAVAKEALRKIARYPEKASYHAMTATEKINDIMKGAR